MMMSCTRPPVTSLKKQLTSVPKFARRKKTSSQCDQIKTKLRFHEKIKFNLLIFSLKFIKIKSVILFAPACSSYDQFKNFEERGNYFKKLILKKLKKSYV